MQRKFRKELSIGLLCFAISLILKQFTATPEFILGGLTGISLCFEIIGILPDKIYNYLKEWKKGILSKV